MATPYHAKLFAHAHSSTLGADYTGGEVEAFAKAVCNLAELLICPVGGDLPNRDKSGSYFQSRSGHVRLFPLAEPS